MAKRRGAVTDGRTDAAATEEGSGGDGQPKDYGAPGSADLLDYMSDLLNELRCLADQHRWRTLSGILALAQAEAAIRRDEINGRDRR